MLHPDVLLEFAFFFVENELLYFLRIHLLLPSFFLHLHRLFFTFTLLKNVFSDVAVGLGGAVILVPFPGLLQFSLHAADLSHEYVFRDVEVFPEVFPGDLLHLVAVGDGCQFLFYLPLVGHL
jgi:hypothetical protein